MCVPLKVFGEMGVVGLDKDLRAALQKGPASPSPVADNWMGSRDSLQTRQRPKTTGGFSSQDFLNIPPSPGMGARRFVSTGSLRSGSRPGSGRSGAGSRMNVGKGLIGQGYSEV